MIYCHGRGPTGRRAGSDSACGNTESTPKRLACLVARIRVRYRWTKERGKEKFKYSRWKVAWDTIERLVRAGHTAQVAIDNIYDVYGNLTVSK